MVFNATRIKTSSDGAWQGDNPLNCAFPLLTVQIAVVLFTSRLLAFLLKPLRQPKVVAEILGGILLGPSALGRNKEFLKFVFPPWSTPILESVASIGLLFFLFLVGLELDLTTLRHSGRKAFTIALAGISLPFVFGAAVSLLLRKATVDEDTTLRQHEAVGYGQFLVFMGVSLSITAFPVLARILAELKLLTTHVGQTAMAAAAVNDIAAWILLALAVALSGNGGGDAHQHKDIWVLLSGLAFVVFMMVVIRPAMKRVGRICSSEHDGGAMHEACICLTLTGVMVAGFVTDLIGIHSIFGAFVFGLTIPQRGSFADRLIERIEDFVAVLLLPLYFASSGLKTDVAKIRGAEAWAMLAVVISTASAGKILGTFVTAMMFTIPARESLTLGVLMNTKGLVELIVLNIGKEKKVLNDEMFAILVLMAIFTTFVTTPAVMAIYKPSRRQTSSPSSRKTKGQKRLSGGQNEDELRILVCVRGPRNVPSLIRLIESFRTTNTSLKLYVMHLVELTDLPSSIAMVQRARRDGVPFINRVCQRASQDHIAAAFNAYGLLESPYPGRRVSIRHMKGISALATMHEDICHVAEDKRVTMIILPFHKRWGEDEDKGMMASLGKGWRTVNQRVMENAKCSVAVLVDRGFGHESNHQAKEGTAGVGDALKRVGVVFCGGPDDREAMEIGSWMAKHPTTRVTLLRFLDKAGAESSSSHAQREKEMDEAAVEEFKERRDGLINYEQREVDGNLRRVIEATRQSKEYELLILGKGQKPMMEARAELETYQEEEQLGWIGAILASSDRDNEVSTLVIQRYDKGDAKMVEGANV